MSVPLRWVNVNVSVGSSIQVEVALLFLFKDISWNVRKLVQLFKESGFAFVEQLVLCVDLKVEGFRKIVG